MNEQANAAPKSSRWRQAGLFFAWAGGIAGVTAVGLALVWLIVNLFTKGASLTLAKLSDWLFWGFAALLGIGLIAPTEPGTEKKADPKTLTSRRFSASSTSRAAPTDQDDAPDPLDKFEERRLKTLQKRMARVYNPWRWRFWMSSLFVLGFSILFGLLS